MFTGRPRVQGVTAHDQRPIHSGWAMCAVPPDPAESPSALESSVPQWREADVPGTVASALRRRGELDLDSPSDFDAVDWWYRAQFGDDARGEQAVLCFDGLATLADVWLNGEHV